VRVPKKLLVIGDLEAITLEGGGSWKPRGAVLGVTLARKVLWIVFRRKGRRKTKMELTTTGSGELKRRCKVLSVTYTSSAWGDGERRYVHTFRRPPTLWSDNTRSPTLLRISSAKMSVKSDGIHG
jgi:hypothetical protein